MSDSGGVQEEAPSLGKTFGFTPSSDNLIISDNLRMRGTKTGFYGFNHLRFCRRFAGLGFLSNKSHFWTYADSVLFVAFVCDLFKLGGCIAQSLLNLTKFNFQTAISAVFFAF